MRTLIGETALPTREFARRGVGPVNVSEWLQVIELILTFLALVVAIIAIAMRD